MACLSARKFTTKKIFSEIWPKILLFQKNIVPLQRF